MWMACGALAALLAGCQREEPIESYQIPKQYALDELAASRLGPPAGAAPRQSAQPRDRMLAAIVPHESKAWFFKLLGSKAVVAAQVEPFHQFVKSVRFDEGPDAAPKWQLPEGWRQRPSRGNQMRYATIDIGSGDERLELSVTTLEKPSSDERQYVLDNVNRWRNQVGLPPISLGQLSEHTVELKLADSIATVVDLQGVSQAGMGGGPFSGGAGNGN